MIVKAIAPFHDFGYTHHRMQNQKKKIILSLFAILLGFSPQATALPLKEAGPHTAKLHAKWLEPNYGTAILSGKNADEIFFLTAAHVIPKDKRRWKELRLATELNAFVSTPLKVVGLSRGYDVALIAIARDAVDVAQIQASLDAVNATNDLGNIDTLIRELTPTLPANSVFSKALKKLHRSLTSENLTKSIPQLKLILQSFLMRESLVAKAGSAFLQTSPPESVRAGLMGIWGYSESPRPLIAAMTFDAEVHGPLSHPKESCFECQMKDLETRSTLHPTLSQPITLERQSQDCPALFTEQCYRIPMRSWGFSGGALVTTADAVSENPDITITAMITHFEPLAGTTYATPIQEVLKVASRLRKKASQVGYGYEEKLDESRTFLYLSDASVHVLKGPFADQVVRAHSPFDRFIPTTLVPPNIAPPKELPPSNPGSAIPGGGEPSGGLDPDKTIPILLRLYQRRNIGPAAPGGGGVEELVDVENIERFDPRSLGFYLLPDPQFNLSGIGSFDFLTKEVKTPHTWRQPNSVLGSLFSNHPLFKGSQSILNYLPGVRTDYHGILYHYGESAIESLSGWVQAYRRNLEQPFSEKYQVPTLPKHMSLGKDELGGIAILACAHKLKPLPEHLLQPRKHQEETLRAIDEGKLTEQELMFALAAHRRGGKLNELPIDVITSRNLCAGAGAIREASFEQTDSKDSMTLTFAVPRLHAKFRIVIPAPAKAFGPNYLGYEGPVQLDFQIAQGEDTVRENQAASAYVRIHYDTQSKRYFMKLLMASLPETDNRAPFESFLSPENVSLGAFYIPLS